MPETKVTTAITAAMPITTPSSVSTERSLFAHSERSAIRMASAMFMERALGVRLGTAGLVISLQGIGGGGTTLRYTEPGVQDAARPRTGPSPPERTFSNSRF